MMKKTSNDMFGLEVEIMKGANAGQEFENLTTLLKSKLE
jgi:hypothetical protein